MPDVTDPPPGNQARLEDRARKLAEDKSNLQLIIEMIRRLSALPGLDNTVDSMLRIVLESVGGTNVTIFYLVDTQVFRVDLFGARSQTNAIDDAMARSAFETRVLVESNETQSTPQDLPGMPSQQTTMTWAFPLLAGSVAIGACKVDGVVGLESRQLRSVLPVFFNYAALVLKNEILGHTRLQRAYDEVTATNASLRREVEERRLAEQRLLSATASLERQTTELSRGAALLRATLESTKEGILATGKAGLVTCFNQQFLDMWRLTSRDLEGQTDRHVFELLSPLPKDPSKLLAQLDSPGGTSDESYELLELKDGRAFERYWRLQRVDSNTVGRVWSFRDISERRALQQKLLLAQKQEAVGQLAAGIAHEINTPAQFVGDNVHFLQEVYEGLAGLMRIYKELLRHSVDGPESTALKEQLEEAEAAADLPFLLEHAPLAVTRALEGISRISSIVSAMKEFAQEGRAEDFSPSDINRALRATLTIATNEYKYVADVETQLADLPLVPCNICELNQVFLHVIINAAHAIAETQGKNGQKGKIRVRTALEDRTVRIDIADTGCGIPPAIRDRIFDPFFTTKPVGKGRGQGLTIARAFVVDKHGGDLTFESEVGKGTTFSIRIPVAGAARAQH